MKISQNKISTNFENCNDNLWTPCITVELAQLFLKNFFEC